MSEETPHLLVKNAGFVLRVTQYSWVVAVLLVLGLSVTLYTQLPPEDEPLVAALITAGIAIATFILGLVAGKVIVCRMTQIGDQMEVKTLLPGSKIERFRLQDIVSVKASGIPNHWDWDRSQKIFIRVRSRWLPFMVDVYADNCDAPRILAHAPTSAKTDD